MSALGLGERIPSVARRRPLDFARGEPCRKITIVSTTTIPPARHVRGRIRVPGDKSISHRYAMIAALAHGPSRLSNYAPGPDCQRPGQKRGAAGGPAHARHDDRRRTCTDTRSHRTRLHGVRRLRARRRWRETRLDYRSPATGRAAAYRAWRFLIRGLLDGRRRGASGIAR